MSSNTGVRYGKIETMTIDDNGVMAAVIETVHNYEVTTKLYRYTAQVFADDRKHLIAEVLKLTDKLDTADVSSVSFEVEKRNTGSPYKMQVCWTTK